MNGVARMKPFAIITIMKKGMRRTNVWRCGQDLQVQIEETGIRLMMIEKTPASIIGYMANETKAVSHLVQSSLS